MIPIDAYTFRREIDKYVDKYGHINMTITQFMIAVEHSGVDAVPVIRCKDCEFYDAGYEIGCALNHKRTSLNDYCSKAERREE